MFSAPKAKRQVHELKTPQERYWPRAIIFATSKRRSTCFRSDEETEAMPAKSVHRSGNQQATMVTILKRTGRTLPTFFVLNYVINVKTSLSSASRDF